MYNLIWVPELIPGHSSAAVQRAKRVQIQGHQIDCWADWLAPGEAGKGWGALGEGGVDQQVRYAIPWKLSEPSLITGPRRVLSSSYPPCLITLSAYGNVLATRSATITNGNNMRIVVLLILTVQISPLQSRPDLLFCLSLDGRGLHENSVPAGNAQRNAGRLLDNVRAARKLPDHFPSGNTAPRKDALLAMSIPLRDDIDIVRLHRHDGLSLLSHRVGLREGSSCSGNKIGEYGAIDCGTLPTLKSTHFPHVVLRC